MFMAINNPTQSTLLLLLEYLTKNYLINFKLEVSLEVLHLISAAINTNPTKNINQTHTKKLKSILKWQEHSSSSPAAQAS